MANPDPSLVVSLTSASISLISAFISGTVAWLTLLRPGTVRMTKPTIVCFTVNTEDQMVIPQIYLRTLLYCTAKRGTVIENMFVTLNQSGSVQTFSAWSYGNIISSIIFPLLIRTMSLSFYQETLF